MIRRTPNQKGIFITFDLPYGRAALYEVHCTVDGEGAPCKVWRLVLGVFPAVIRLSPTVHLEPHAPQLAARVLVAVHRHAVVRLAREAE